MMIAIRLDQSEWDLLAGEPAELLKLYCALKRRMDFSTGIAGRKTLLNELVLREGFTVDPIPGRPKQKPITREMYRSAVRRLEKLGLLVTLGIMVYQFPHARRDAPSKRATTELQPAGQPEQQPENTNPDPSDSGPSGEFEGEQQPEQQPHSSPSNNLLPESGNTYTTHTAHEKFAMNDSWEPNTTTFTGVLYRNGMAGQTFHPDQLLEFRSYWIANPDRHRTQAQWEHALVQQLKRQSRLQQSTEGYSHETRGRPNRSRTRNAHDILTDPNW